MLKRKCKITFIAHGSTIHSQEGIISDSEKHPPLTEHGHEEIKKVCKYLRSRGIRDNKLYCSPGVRCVQSAQKISKVFKQDYEVLDGLSIRKCGVLNGKSFKTLIKQYPNNPSFSAIDFEGGESLADFNARVIQLIETLVEENIGSRLIVVTYPSVIQSVIANILGISVENQAKILIKTGSLTQISCFEGWSSLIYSGYVPL